MGSNAKSVQLKVFVDKKKKKVMFAEADQDFVEILFSFLTLPLGKIARILSINNHTDEKSVKVGSLTSLYESIMNLDIERFTNDECKIALVNPKNSSAALCQKLKVNLDDIKPTVNDFIGDGVLVKNKGSFLITDDLNVIPVLLNTGIELLNALGVEYVDLLDERIVVFGLEEFSNLLKLSLLTKNPLTNLVFGENKTFPCSSCTTNSTSNTSPLPLAESVQPCTIKLLVQKSKKKVLCAQVEKFFVELLFSFLTIPLGFVKRLTMDNSSSMGIDNLYNSISSLGDGNYLKSDDIKTILLSPKIAANYLRVTEFMPIYEEDTRPGSFTKGEGAIFVVSDDLEVSVPPSISTILKFNTLGIPVGDIEVMEVSIGKEEALLILKTSLTSTSTLTDCLYAFTKQDDYKRKLKIELMANG